MAERNPFPTPSSNLHANEVAARCITNEKVLKIIKQKRNDIFLKIQKAYSSKLAEGNFKYIYAKLRIEERNATHSDVIFRCSPSWMILMTKFEICQKFPTIPLHLINIVHGHTIAKDTQLLKEIGVEKTDDFLCAFVNNDHNEVINIDRKSKVNQQISNASVSSCDDSISNKPGMMSLSSRYTSIPISTELHYVPKRTWKCPLCTFENDIDRPGCLQCSTAKPGINDNLEDSPTMHLQTLNEHNIQRLPHSVREEKIGWQCEACTFLNQPTRPGCEQCSAARPADYHPPQNYVLTQAEKERIERELMIEEQAKIVKDEERVQNYQHLLSAENRSIVTSTMPEECMICITECNPEDIVVLKECLHKFCKECLIGHINASEGGSIVCPYYDNYQCDNVITEREIKALLSEEDFNKYLSRGLSLAEASIQNAFHCKTPDCHGWCEYDDQVNTFTCPICNQANCLTCKAIHEGINCKQYQEKLSFEAHNNKNAKKTKELLENMLAKGDAMHCPQCQIILMKKDGCDWLRCTMCKHEICWVTRGSRWGPKGSGDTSGGCKCRVNGKQCHPKCINCH